MSEVYIQSDPIHDSSGAPDYTKIRESYLESLRKGKCQVTFLKKNGESRVMECTLNFGMIPEDKHPKSDGNESDRDKSVNTEVVKVFDTEKGEWRSFRVDSVTDFRLSIED